MFSLAEPKKQSSLRKWEAVYFAVSVALVVVGGVYEHFGHGVYSNYMIYAFAFPLIGGSLLCRILNRIQKKYMPGHWSMWLYSAGIATLTVGSLVQGVLDIYGTTNYLTGLYWFVGFIFVIFAVISYIAALLYFKFNPIPDEPEYELSPAVEESE